MPQRRYTIPINNRDFEFDWDKDTEPTDAEIVEIYKASLNKPKPIVPISKPKPANFSMGYRGINQPLVDVNVGHNISDKITKPSLTTSPNMARLKGFFGGALEGVDDVVSSMTTPIDLAAMATGLTPFKKAAALLTGGRGLWNMGEGVYEGDSGKFGTGALEAGLSTLGLRRPMTSRTSTVSDVSQPTGSGGTINNIPEVTRPSQMPEVQANPITGELTREPIVERMPGQTENNLLYGIRKNTTDFPTVPDRLRAPSTNQVVFDTLLPSRTKELIGQRVKLPKDVDTPANSVSDDVVPKEIKNIISDPSTPPEIKQAAQQVVNLRSKDESLKRGLSPYIRSGLSTLEGDSEAGRSISRLIQQTRIEGEMSAGQWSSRFKDIVKDLDDNEWQNFIQAVEGKGVPYDKKVLKAVLDYNRLDTEVVDAAKNAGMVMEDFSGNIIPFEGQKNYWPRIYSDEFISSKQKNIFDELIAEGHSPTEAQTILESATKFGNRLISPQHKRQANVAGYRTDKEAYLLHLDQMGKRIAESKNLGPRDLGDVNSPLSKLVAGTKDKEYITDILQRHLGRVKPDNPAADKWVGKANSLAAMTDLGLFIVSNQAQKAMIPIRGDITAFAKALTQFKTKAGKDWAEQSGALQNALRDSIQDLGGEHWVSKLYRTGASERSNRTLASLTGKFTAEGDFVRAKKGDKGSIDRLKDLLLTDDEGIKSVLKQEFLDEKQLYTAGARMSEMTQGRAGSVDLPPKWKSSPEAKLMSMYKGYAFRQTKAMKDAFLNNPGKFLAVGLPLLAVTGEAVGDVKAAIRAGVNPDLDVDDAIANRGKGNFVDEILKSANTPEKQRQLASRVIENLSEAWTLGILSDLISSSGENPTGLIKFIAGPVPGMAADIAYGGAKSIKDLDIRPAVSHTVKNLVPAPVGYPLSRQFAGKSRPSSSMRPRLPSVKF